MSYNNKAKRDEDYDLEDSSAQYVSEYNMVLALYASLDRANFKLVPDDSGVFSGHKLYRRIKLSYGDNIWAWLPYALDRDRSAFMTVVGAHFEDAYGKATSKEEFKVLANIKDGLGKNAGSRNNNVLLGSTFTGEPMKEYRTRSAIGSTAYSHVPQVSWLPNLAGLDARKLLSLLPDAEAKLLMLTLGRAVCGRNGLKLLEGDIKHFFRTALIIVGIKGGLGKSTLLKNIVAGMEALGYTTSTIPDGAARFDWAPCVTSDLAHLDDLTPASQLALLNNDKVKTMVTGGIMRTELKGKAAVDVQPNCAVIACSNHFSKNQFLKLDDGVLSRFAFLYTYNDVELVDMQKVDGYSSMTAPTWARIAKQYKCSEVDLSVYLLARCAEMFLDATGYELVDEQLYYNGDDSNYLQELTDELRSKLYYQANLQHVRDLLTSTCNLVALALANTDSPKAYQAALNGIINQDFGWKLLAQAMEAYAITGKNDSLDYIVKLNSNCHTSIALGADRWSNHNNRFSAPKAFQVMTEELLSEDSYKFPSSPAYYATAWTEAKKLIPAKVDEYRNIHMEAPKQLGKVLSNVLALLA